MAKDLEEDEKILNQSIEKLKVVEANRLALVSQLRDALNEQVTFWTISPQEILMFFILKI